MRKAAFMGVALAAAVAFPFWGSSANAKESSSYQGQVTMLDGQLSDGPSRFNSYWFVYGVPPYDGGVAPWKLSQAKQDPRDLQDPEFDPYWFVYGVPPHDGVAPSAQHQAE